MVDDEWRLLNMNMFTGILPRLCAVVYMLSARLTYDALCFNIRGRLIARSNKCAEGRRRGCGGICIRPLFKKNLYRAKRIYLLKIQKSPEAKM